MASVTTTDPHSYGRPDRVAVRHLSLDLDVDFVAQRLSGTATLRLEHRDPAAAEVVLDTWDLDVQAVTRADGTALDFSLGEHDPILGRPLTIATGGADRVVIRYATGADARAVQWLGPAQTASGQPFLFTQSQAILARSWIPLQDSPSVRITYDATVRVPSNLLAVMSATNPTERNPEGRYSFAMEHPIAPYLVALAVGDLEFRPLGDRCGVYAEPQTIDAAAWELEGTEDQVAAAERLFGPYRWGRYDVLVLPPSFPYGGMENPRLTFATPTIIVGDRSLVTLVAHEIAHSWSGNLVTNATWNDIWINEGFTTYVEQRIDEELYGKEFVSMLQGVWLAELHEDVALHAPEDTRLALDKAGGDPETPSQVPYFKGELFLVKLERAVGRERFDTWLRGYFDTHAFEPMDTPTLLAYLERELLDPAGLTAEELGIDRWVNEPGVPDDVPRFPSDVLDQVDEQVAAFLGGTPAGELGVAGWRPHQWVHLISHLPRDLDTDRLAELDATFALSKSGNGEILEQWLTLAVTSSYVLAAPDVDAAMADFLTRQGRARFLRPIYRSLVATPEGRKRAEEIYAVARPGYHAVSQVVIDRILATGTG